MLVPLLSAFSFRTRRRVAALCCAAALASCTEPLERTQVVVVIDAEESLRSRIRYVDVEVRTGSDDEENWPLERSDRLMPRRSGSGWPLDFRLATPETGTSYLVMASAKAADDKELTVVRALSGYVKGKTRELRLRFDEACAAREAPCPSTFSCSAGRCIDIFVPTDELAPPNEPVAMRGDEPVSPSTPAMRNEPMAGSGGPGCTGPACGAAGACSAGDKDCAQPCATRDAQGRCQFCPTGFAGSAADGCSPVLIDLQLAGAELEPVFDPEHEGYHAALPLLASQATLKFQAVAAVELLVNGSKVGGDGEWTAPLELGENSFVITLNAAGHPSRSYRLTLERRGDQRQQLKAVESRPGDAFGAGLDVSNDRLVIGAPFEDGTETDSGAAYVFVRTADGWKERAYLKADQPRAGAHFGHSIAIDGDRIAVAAPEDSGGGAVYVFELRGEEWTRVATFRESPGSLLGRGLALQGDLLAVGAPGEQASDRESGSVYLYARDATGWQRSTMLVQQKPGTQDWTGSSVALDGDTLITGATGATVPGESFFSGAVYAFQREGDNWRELPLLAPTQVEPGAFFGEATDIRKDLIAIGGFFSNVGLTGGTAYLFERGTDGVFTEEAVLRPANTRGGDWFGSRVAIASESAVLIGASRESSAAGGIAAAGSGTLDKSGAVYLFERARSGWRQVVEIKSAVPVALEEFGRHLVVSGDEFFVSAPSDTERNGKSPNTGSVYVFR